MKQLTYYDPAICVLGLSSAGLSLARMFSACYKTIGYDADATRIDELMNSHSVNGFACTSDLEAIRGCNFYVVVVSPSSGTKDRYIAETLHRMSRLVGKVINCGDFLVYDTSFRSLPPEDEYLPLVEKESGLNNGKQFFVGYSFAQRKSLRRKKRVITSPTLEIQSIIEEIYAAAIPRTSLSTQCKNIPASLPVSTFLQQLSPVR